MGNYASKLLPHVDENRKESNERQAATQQVTNQNGEMCTPTLPDKILLLDPRSVSAGIPRTPIEINDTPVGVAKGASSAIPKYLQKKKYLETDMDVVMPPLTPKKHFVSKLINTRPSSQSSEDEAQNYLTPNVNIARDPKELTPIEKERYRILGLDPRSPAADFNRTPILMPRSLALIKARSQEHLNRKGSYETDVYNPRNSYQEICTSFNVPEIQLMPNITSLSLKTLNRNERNELNMHTSGTPQSDSDSSIFVSEEELTVLKNPKFKSENGTSFISDQQTLDADKEKEMTDKQADRKDKIIEQNMKAMYIKDKDKIKIWHDPSEESVSGKVKGKENVEETLTRAEVLREDIIITFDTVKNASPSKAKTEGKKRDVERKKDVEGKKKEIFKTDLKLESDKERFFSLDNKYNNEISKSRTPLGNRSNNDQIQGTMPTKSPQQLLKNKTITAKMQQENTPPHKKHTLKLQSKIHWDPNSTVII